MAVDYSVYTDIFDLKNGEAILREYPEPDAAVLVTLKRGQKLRRLDTFYWNGAWVRFYADVQGGAKYEGYLHADDVVSATDDAPTEPAPQPAPQQPAPAPPAPPQHQAPQPTPPQPQPAPQQQAPAAMMALGCVDADVSEQSCAAFLSVVERTTGLPPAQIPATAEKNNVTAPSIEKLSLSRLPVAAGAMTVAQVQEGLKTAGFFPGGKVDGIYGYRTRAAVRLFQEYVRSVEKVACLPDGRFGPQTQDFLQRWLSNGAQPNWSPRAGEYDAWLGLLERVKQKYLAEPGRVLEKVNAFAGRTDTRKVQAWDFTGPGHIHLIGVRRAQANNKSDDIFIALIKGLVFKFQGSTEPGSSSNAAGPPYITPGQHDFHFGWHKKSYLALRPRSAGALIVRAGADRKLDDADLDRGLEANDTIHIHWGGRGLDGDVNKWSEGCQVISGSVYVNPAHELVDCRAFAAVEPFEAMTRHGKTRGAYNLLSDLATAYASDLPDDTVRYTLLNESDLDLAPELKQALEESRSRVMGLIGH